MGSEDLSGCPTVKEYAKTIGVSTSYVYEAIRDGFLKVAGNRPQRIVGGRMPVTRIEFAREVCSVLGGVPTHRRGFNRETGDLHVLKGTEIKVVPFNRSPSLLPDAISRAAELAE